MKSGFLLLFAAGICQGSFGLGYKKYAPYTWAAFWAVYNILCAAVAAAFAGIAAPRLWEVISGYGAAYWVMPLLCGALWGLSAVGFSKGISLIGMSMVYGISMGISTVVGSAVPIFISGNLPEGGSGILFWSGLLLTLAGVAVITAAGVKRDGGMKGSAAGMFLAVLSGLGSGAMNVGFSYSGEAGAALASLGCSQAAVSAVRWLPVLAGGCLAGVIWCVCELSVRNEWRSLVLKGSGMRALKLLGVSIVWYAALLLYGLSSDMLGDIGSSIGWILFNSLALIISVLWGIKTGEWKNKSKKLLFAGCIILIIAWIFIALV